VLTYLCGGEPGSGEVVGVVGDVGDGVAMLDVEGEKLPGKGGRVPL
jgi:hypothetical protein